MAKLLRSKLSDNFRGSLSRRVFSLLLKRGELAPSECRPPSHDNSFSLNTLMTGAFALLVVPRASIYSATEEDDRSNNEGGCGIDEDDCGNEEANCGNDEVHCGNDEADCGNDEVDCGNDEGV